MLATGSEHASAHFHRQVMELRLAGWLSSGSSERGPDVVVTVFSLEGGTVVGRPARAPGEQDRTVPVGDGLWTIGQRSAPVQGLPDVGSRPAPQGF